ncbi:CocE/NonD family hydrolase [Flavilitoribacter nigricans]|uniref:Acylase n=1 Tax=Flavilitoribacter nigricans (strain ATCC 23147 / DSM 23189 / NBRC 102662 / NCIMB 1420 / SS-2) TaxID=1122177 RepID=A0A2D0N2S5_FLAN2|nr:CocE/NonD family hydrolase [Flavilitoribacter nigricans]PHN02686.1 acylase [Flavilitoribacter nigricans DSM 23189 = NBRC 102662]
MPNYRQIILLLTLLLSSQVFLGAQDNIREQLEAIAIIDQKVMMPMRDGIRLATDIYRPKTDQPVPIIFSKTPYNFNSWGDGEERTRTYQRAIEAVKRGYAYVVQNERGRYFSEGKWDILGPPTTDGYDAFSWMKNQEWSNGKIATLGCSSTAEWQMAVAALDHPAHAAMVPQGYGAGVGRVGRFHEQGNWYRGGAQQMLFTAWLYGVQNDEFRPRIPEGATQEDLIRISRFFDLAPEMPRVDWSEGLAHLPVQDIIKNQHGSKGIYFDMIRRKPNDPAWYKGGLYHDDMPFGVPSFWFASWYDVSTGPNLELYNHVRNNAKDPEVANNQYLVIAPTLHCAYTRATENTIVGERSVGDARLNYDEQIYAWFDYWLKGEKNGFLEETPKVQYYTMGSNKWQHADTWPPESAKMTTYYFSSGGQANSLYGDGRLSLQPTKGSKPDKFAYDPMNPVPSYGGNVCCTGNAVQGGAFDQQVMETRHDILVYTSEPLEEGIEVSGFIESTLYVSSDAKDTDFTIKIIDVYPDGTAYNLDETIQRARYREGYDQEVFMKDGEVYKLEMTPMSTSNYFAKGHRIRVEISSSNFPRFERNLNTGGNNYDESKGVIAHNTIHHSADHPTQIRLPIVQSSAASPTSSRRD